MKWIFALALLGVVLAGLVCSVRLGWWLPAVPQANEWGHFSGEPVTRWLANGRGMELVEEFSYVDPRGKKWLAKPGAQLDGASIPRAFWSVVGGPYEGPYRNASIVHDTECAAKTEKSDHVHLMFYEACRCGGLSEADAKMLYTAVYHFGPKWSFRDEVRAVVLANGTRETHTVRVAVPTFAAVEPPDDPTMERLQAHIRKNAPSLTELQKLDWDKLP